MGFGVITLHPPGPARFPRVVFPVFMKHAGIKVKMRFYGSL